MGSYYYYFVYGLQLCFLLLVSIAVPSSSSSSSSHIFMSGDVLKEQRYAGRILLQTPSGVVLPGQRFTARNLPHSLPDRLRACPVAQAIQFANYTILTSKCKGPVYPAKECCAAFGDFACPFSKYLNDVSYDCSAVMFTYIDLQTNYPRGFFSSECREDIPCPGDSPMSSPVDADASAAAAADGGGGGYALFVFTLLVLLW